MSALFTPFEVRGTRIRNRVWVSPMCQYTVTARDGVPTDWHLVHLGSMARGGAGLVMAEASAVVPEGRISAEDTGIWNDAQAAAWAPVARFIADQGAVPAIQLAHAGRKASVVREWGEGGRRGNLPVEEGGWPTVSASAEPFPGFAAPRALELDELPGVVEAFAAAARRAVEAGFEVVEVHAAHGYLLHQFLSPLSNFRDDAYGGSLENRARLVLEVVRAVRAAVGDDVAVFVRFSATDWTEGGWDVEQTSTVAGWACDAGADLVDVSTGGLVLAKIPTGPGYQVPFAEEVAATSGVPVNAVGLIDDAEHAERIVAAGQADAVMVGRGFLRDPHLAMRWAQELGETLEYWPGQYARALPFA